MHGWSSQIDWLTKPSNKPPSRFTHLGHYPRMSTETYMRVCVTTTNSITTNYYNETTTTTRIVYSTVQYSTIPCTYTCTYMQLCSSVISIVSSASITVKVITTSCMWCQIVHAASHMNMYIHIYIYIWLSTALLWHVPFAYMHTCISLCICACIDSVKYAISHSIPTKTHSPVTHMHMHLCMHACTPAHFVAWSLHSCVLSSCLLLCACVHACIRTKMQHWCFMRWFISFHHITAT